MFRVSRSTARYGIKLAYCGTSVLGKTSTALQLTIQFTFGCKLKDEIHTRWVMEVTVETKDIGVPAGHKCKEVFRKNPDETPN